MGETQMTKNSGFKNGQRVSIIRHRHGWCDGSISGVITRFGSSYFCIVEDSDGYEYEIKHKRDIRCS